MRRPLLYLFFLFLPVAQAFSFTAAGGGIAGSRHDMNVVGGFAPSSDKEVCVFCHVPHHAQSDGDYQAPLWSRNLKNTTFPSFQALPTTEATIGDPMMGPTRLCLSCHDGVVAPGMDAKASGHDKLNGTHPLGMDYEALSLSKPNKFRPIDTPFYGNSKMRIRDVLYQGAYVTCATCHDPHNRRNVSHMPQSYNFFVYAPEKDSSLCCTCHTQGTPGQ